MVHRASAYPIEGILYFLSHPSLWKKCFCGLLITIAVAIASLVGFSLLISPFADFLTKHGCPHWLSIIVGIIFMLIESSVITIIFSLIFLPILMEQVFIHTIKLRGYKEAILEKPAPNMGWKMFVGSLAFAGVQILIMLLTIPVNLIPIFGQIAYCYINGYVHAWGYRLSDLMPYRGMTFTQTRRFVKAKNWEFASFGSVAFALELIPLFNWLFIFTNSVAAALWAVDDYKKYTKGNSSSPAASFYDPNGLDINRPMTEFSAPPAVVSPSTSTVNKAVIRN